MSDWTDERRELCLSLWVNGSTARQIAMRLGGVSRNAVLGLVHRAGLSNRAVASRPSRVVIKPPAIPRPLRITARNQVFAEPEPRAPTVVVEWRDEPPGSATPLTLAAYQCKWPIGDPQDPGFTHCGERAPDGPYCRHHASIAYAPAKERKSRAYELQRSLRRYL